LGFLLIDLAVCVQGFFRRVLAVFHEGFGVAQNFLGLSFNLQPATLDFLLGVAHKFAGFCLHLAGNVFDFARDLVFVHDGSLEVVNENESELFQGSAASLRTGRPWVCVLAYKHGQ
jgi:hypothetical protein